MDVLVTDAQQRTALNVIQSLGRKNINVFACEKKGIPFYNIPGFLSRYCRKRFYSPDLEKDPIGYIKFLNNFADKDIVLMPIKITTITFILNNTEKISKKIHYCLPDISSISTALNKSNLLDFAEKIGVNIPKTFVPKTLEEARKLEDKLKFPIVIKVTSEGNLYQEKRYVIVKNKKFFLEEYIRMHKEVQRFPMIQEFVVGENVGFHAIFDSEKKLKGFFMHKRIRQYPLSGGPSTLCIGINDKNLYDVGMKLLKRLNWKGLAMVEFIRDSKARCWLMEINPRFWGSFPLAVKSGVNFPYLLYNISRGNRIRPKLHYRNGAKLRFLFSDLKWLRANISISENKISVLKQYVNEFFTRGTKEGNFAFDDPLPTLPYLAEFLYFIIKGKKAMVETIKE